MKLALLAVFLALPLVANAADCPTPKRLTCEQLAAKMDARCPKGYMKEFPDCTCPKCSSAEKEIVKVEVPGPEVKVPGPITIIYQDVPVPAKPTGHGFAGLGATYFHGVGLAAIVGYKWPNGWMLMGGPTWTPQNDTLGYDDVAMKGCVKIPYSTPGHEGDRPLGAQVFVAHTF